MGTGKAGRPAGRHSELRSLLAAIVEYSSDAIVSTSLDGIVTSWNAGAEAIYGYTAEEMIGQHLSLLVPPDRPDELVPILDQIRRGGRVTHYETKRLHKDGTIIDVSVSASPVYDDGGAVDGLVGVARDITERKWVEAERDESAVKRNQAERMESLAKLTAAVGRDFNILLADIMADAARAAEAAAGNPAAQAAVRQILATAGRAVRLAWELLVFGGGQPGQHEGTDLNALLLGARGLLNTSLGEHIELRLVTAPDLPAVLADRGRIEQMLINLANNAREAMPEGGVVTFSIGMADLNTVRDIRDAEWPETWPGQYVEIAVSDTGCGMDSETMRHVFEPFFTTKEPVQGRGLGLSTVYGIVTKAGGFIAIDSKEGTGTTLRIYLPVIDGPAPAPQARMPFAASGCGETILVADGEPAVRELTARILRHSGYRTIEASTGEEALALLSSHDVRLLLTGALMPGMPGPALTEALETKPGLRVLRMSGAPAGGAKRGAGVAVIRKPFSARDLLEKVRAVLATGPGE
jgi:two-component system cell cycle sensor histidine kinase/response regulator CckA